MGHDISYPDGDIPPLVERQIQVAFAEAIRGVYSIVLFIVVAGWLTTWLIPELPLSRSVGEPQAAAAD